MPALRALKNPVNCQKIGQAMTRVVYAWNNERAGKKFSIENGIKNLRVVIFNRAVVPKYTAVATKDPADALKDPADGLEFGRRL
jgi:hypothetical protein